MEFDKSSLGIREAGVPGEPQPVQPVTPQEPAVIQEPAAPEPAEPAQPVFDFATFGEDFKSADDVKAFIDNARSGQSKVKEMEDELGKLRNQTPFADETLYKLDAVKRTRPEAFDIARQLAFGNISDLDQIRLRLEYESPKFKALSDEDKSAYLEGRYRLSHDLEPLKSEDGYSEEEVAQRAKLIKEAERQVRADKVKMSIDAEEARSYLEGKVFEGITPPKVVTPEEAQKQRDEDVRKLGSLWAEPMKQVAAKSKVDIVGIDPETKKPTVISSMDIPEDSMKKYLGELNQHILTGGLTPDKLSVAEAQAYVEDRFWSENRPRLVHEAMVKARSMSAEEWSKFIFHPTPQINPKAVPPTGGPVKTTEASIKRALERSDNY